MLDCIEIQPDGPADAAVIWLHGLGADGNDFVPIIDELSLPAGHGLRFIFPNAPTRPITINGGMAMRAWYDILGMDLTAREDAEGIEASREAVEALIAREINRGIAEARIVVAGFSQGGAIALYCGLRYPARLGGIMALSTYLPLRDTLTTQASAANRDIPIFMAHGSTDPVVAPQLGRASRDILQQQGYTIEWRAYPMQHQVCMPEIQAIGIWLQSVLG